MAVVKISEGNEGLLSHTSANVQILTVDLLEERLESFASSLMERSEGRFDKIFIQICYKDARGDNVLVSQIPNNTEMLKEEVEEVIPIKAPVGNGMDVFQIKNGKLTGLKEFDQEIWREIYPEVLLQLKGKVPGGLGTFKIRRRIRNGTLQFLYKNGLLILVKEVCFPQGIILQHAQDCKIQKLQLKTQEFVKIKKDGGIRRKKKARKKAREKWR